MADINAAAVADQLAEALDNYIVGAVGGRSPGGRQKIPDVDMLCITTLIAAGERYADKPRVIGDAYDGGGE